ncbi:MAG: tetratricopeptide repeat protein [Victivallales bacterium]
MLTLFSLLCPAFAQEQPEQKAYRSRQIGDKAFNDGYYSLAIKFYSQYKNEAADDPFALKDAYLCLFPAYVRDKDAVNARKDFGEFCAKFAEDISNNTESRQRADYWNANIMILEGNFEKAITLFNQILKTAPDISDIHSESLSGLGMAQINLLNWDEAEKTYVKLESVGKGTKWEDYARKQRILIAIYKGEIDKARSMLSINDSKNITDILLSVFLLTKDGKAAEAAEIYKKTRGQAPLSGDSLWFNASINLANAFIEKKDFQAALVYQKDAEFFADSDFDREKILIQIINSQALSGNYDAALESYRKFLKNFPNSPNTGIIRLQMARVYHSTKKTQDAINIYREIMENPKNGIVMRMTAAKEAGLLFISEKLFNEAREKFDFIVENAVDSNTKYEAKIQLADIFFLEKKYAAASSEFAKIAKEDKAFREVALLKQINCFFSMKDYRKSIQLVESFMKEFPQGENFQNASFLYGMILLNLRKNDDAFSAFTDFAKNFPNHPDAPRAIFEIGNICFDNGKYKEADENYSKVFETYPKSELAPNALYKKLYSHFLSGDEASAEKDLSALVKYYPESVFTVKGLFWQSDFYRDSGRNDKAEAVLQDILTKFSSVPSTAAEALYECAYISHKTGKNDRAVKYLDELSEKYPNEIIVSEGFMLRGDMYTEANEYEKAIPFYTKAAERRPGSNLETACWGRLGDCYFSIAWKTSDGTNIMSATEYFKKIVNKKNVPLNLREQAIYKLAKCEETIGDKGGALARYREIIYGYQVDADKGEIRDPVWVVKSAQGASRLYIDKGTPEAAEAAISIYKKLIELNIEPKDDFNKAIREIREKFKLKE